MKKPASWVFKPPLPSKKKRFFHFGVLQMILNADYTIDRIHTNYTDLNLTELHFKILEAALHCGSRGVKSSDLYKKFLAFRKLTITEREEVIKFLRE